VISGLRLAALTFLALALLRAPGEGPDQWRYLQWADAALRGDIFALNSEVASPAGVPLSLWSHGPGQLFALGRLAFGSWLPDDQAALLASSGFVLLLWWSLYHALARLCAGNAAAAWVCASVAFLGTHLGYYSKVQSSETFACALLAYIAATLLRDTPWRWPDVLALACAAALLFTVRPQLVLFVAVAYAALLYALVEQHRRKPLRWPWAYAVSATLPILGSALQVALVQRWMTGVWWRSPYVFGDAQFRSMDWLHPQFAAVLVHPWHGLFAYHPAYLVGFTALALLALWAPGRAERYLWGGLTAVVALNLYLQAAWFCWWLGAATFGMRGMAPAAVVLVLALGRCTRVAPTAACWLLLAAGFGALVSFGLWIHGDTNVVTYAELWRLVENSYTRPPVRLALVTAVALAVLTWVLARRGHRADAGWRAAAVAMGGLAAGVLGAGSSPPWPPERVPIGVQVMLLGGAAAVTVASSGRWRAPALRLAQAARAGIVLAMLMTSLLFAGLALRTELRLGDAARMGGFRWQGTVLFSEIEDSYTEYQWVPGFAREKKALRDFLDRAYLSAGIRGDSP
jgi:hypothetical protein